MRAAAEVEDGVREVVVGGGSSTRDRSRGAGGGGVVRVGGVSSKSERGGGGVGARRGGGGWGWVGWLSRRIDGWRREASLPEDGRGGPVRNSGVWRPRRSGRPLSRTHVVAERVMG